MAAKAGFELHSGYILRKCLIINGAGEGNRTLVSGLGSPHSTIEPHPHWTSDGRRSGDERKVFFGKPAGVAGGVGDFDPWGLSVKHKQFRPVVKGERGLRFVERAAAGDSLGNDDDGGFLDKTLVDGEAKACYQAYGNGAKDKDGAKGGFEGRADLARGESVLPRNKPKC